MLRINVFGSISRPLCRGFSQSLPSWKKKGSGPEENSNAAASADFDSSKMKQELEETLSVFSQHVKEARSNTISTENFANLKVDLGNNVSLLKTLATIAARGNKINIVAFDPKQVKRIQTAIVSVLGMPAEPSPKDNQTLSVNVPQQNESKKIATLKLIKEAYEALRNNAANKNSVASIRSKYLSPLKKAASKNTGVSKDAVKKQTAEIETLIKNYSGKLQEAFKKASN